MRLLTPNNQKVRVENVDDFAKKGFKNHVLHQISFVNLLVISLTIWLFEKVIHVLGSNFSNIGS